MNPPATIRVLGVGNVLMEDDGLGPYVVRVLEARYEFPAHVEVEDVGTPGLDFAPYVDEATAVIVVDTVSSEGAPGTIKRYDKAQMLANPLPQRTNPHQPGLRETLMAAELTDSSPDEIVLVGVIPERTGNISRLGDTVRAVVPAVVDAVVAELRRLGVEPTVRPEPRDPNIWWER
jgi:hydrogenase maturation protease